MIIVIQQIIKVSFICIKTDSHLQLIHLCISSKMYIETHVHLFNVSE